MKQIEIKKGQLDLYAIFIASRHFKTIDDFINLEMCSSKFQGNMTKFFYNPIALTPITREFFTYLRTLYIYTEKDELFKGDEDIKSREIQVESYYDIEKEWKTIKEWTGMKNVKEKIFDSNKDDWEEKTSVFDQKLLGKDKLLFLIDTKVNNKQIKFGGYLSTTIKQTRWFIEDKNAFVFTFINDNPMKCDILKGESFNAFTLNTNDVPALFSFGNRNIHFFKKNHISYCVQNCPQSFDYHGKENALVGSIDFIPKRLLVLQLE